MALWILQTPDLDYIRPYQHPVLLTVWRLDNFLLFFLRGANRQVRLFCLDFIPLSGEHVEIQWKWVTELNSCCGAVTPHGSPSLLVKAPQLASFIYFVGERPHKALRGTLQPSLQNGYSQKYTGPNLGVKFWMRTNVLFGQISVKSIWPTEHVLLIYVCIYTAKVVYLFFIILI